MVPLAAHDGDASDLMENAAAKAFLDGLEGFSFVDDGEEPQE